MRLETHRMINEDLCCRCMKCVRKLEKKIEIAKNFAASQTNNMIQRGETVQKN
jgi:hypothetical protein